MKKVIVEFIEEGTDRVIRTCSLEEYNNMIESINNTIPKEYKFLKINKMKKEQSVNSFVKRGAFGKKLTNLCLKLEQSVNELNMELNNSWSDFQPSYCVANKSREEKFDIIVVHARIEKGKEYFVIQDQRRNSPTFSPLGMDNKFTFDEVIDFIKTL